MTGWAITVAAGLLVAAAIGSGLWCVGLLMSFIHEDGDMTPWKRCVAFWSLVVVLVVCVSTLEWMRDTGLWL